MYNWQYYGLLPQSNNTVIFAAPNGQMNGSALFGDWELGSRGADGPTRTVRTWL